MRDLPSILLTYRSTSYSPNDVKTVVFDERMAANRPSVEERWIGTLAQKRGKDEKNEENEENEENE